MRRIIVLFLLIAAPAWLSAQKECAQDGRLVYAAIASVPLAPVQVIPSQIVIPVVVHIIQSGSVTVSDAQVHSQLEALNRDFQAANADLVQVPERFRPFR